MTKTPLFDAAERETERLISRSEQLFRQKIVRPKIRFDIRGRTAGMVRFAPTSIPMIRYNPGLLEKEGKAFLDRVVPHEVAHLVARTLHGDSIKPHGPEWRQVMATLGADPSRCHNFDTSAEPTRRIRRFRYQCGCREHLLSTIRRNRIERGVVYRCRSCGESLSASTSMPGETPIPRARSSRGGRR